MAIYQALVKHLDGHTQILKFPSPTITGQTLIRSLDLSPNLRLITGTLDLTPETLLSASPESNLFPSLSLLPRLLGGKGGFGSLLRGAGTKAGQKKTNNFDACRDMSGRRMRHVNAEKKLEEWKAEAEDRRMEKLAEDFLKKKSKEERKKGKGKEGEVEKYLEKYREDAERCMEKLDESVKESFKLYREGKRKVLPGVGGAAGSKKLKIWMGKKKVEDSDSEEDDDDDVEKKYVVVDDGICTSHAKDDEGTSAAGLVSSADSNLESSAGVSDQSSLDEVIGVSPDGSGASEVQNGDESGKSDFESNTMGESSVTGYSNSESKIQVETEMVVTAEAASGKSSSVSSSEEMSKTKERTAAPQIIDAETVVGATNSSDLEVPLNFNNYISAVELEVLGMERLKTELQTHGLKCGGTLQERAARLFLLKTTPFEKLPKKVLAGKTGGK